MNKQLLPENILAESAIQILLSAPKSYIMQAECRKLPHTVYLNYAFVYSNNILRLKVQCESSHQQLNFDLLYDRRKTDR